MAAYLTVLKAGRKNENSVLVKWVSPGGYIEWKYEGSEPVAEGGTVSETKLCAFLG